MGQHVAKRRMGRGNWRGGGEDFRVVTGGEWGKNKKDDARQDRRERKTEKEK